MELEDWLVFSPERKDRRVRGDAAAAPLSAAVLPPPLLSRLMCNEPRLDTIIMSKAGDKWSRVTKQISRAAVGSL